MECFECLGLEYQEYIQNTEDEIRQLNAELTQIKVIDRHT